MLPTRVYLKGFMSYRDGATMRFDGASLWVLSGPNGVGKSAIFDAITFALYGTYRGVSQHAKDLINHQCDRLVVELDFLVDGEEYRVKRTVSRNGRPTRQASVLGVDGEKRIADTDGDQGFKDWVNDLIGLDYEAFTSSVILLQGESEKLLRQEPRKRHDILARLIDLSPYERLHAACDQHRQQHRSVAAEYGNQLRNTPPVSDEDLQAAESAAERSEKEWREANDEVEAVARLVDRSEQWERLTEDLAGLREKAEDVQALLRREREIREGRDRLLEIRRNLPTVDSIVSDKGRLTQNKAREHEVRSQIGDVERECEDAEAGKEAARLEVERLAGLTERLWKTDAKLSEQAHGLSRKADHLERLEEYQAEWDEAKRKLDDLPSDLDSVLKDAVEEDRRLAEAERALPWLEHLAGSRSDLKARLTAGHIASEELENLAPQLRELEEECKRLDSETEVAREEKTKLSDGVARAEAINDDALQRRADFDEVSSEPTCERCGQEITEEHVERETAHLDGRVTKTEADLQSLKDQHDQAADRLEALEGKLRLAEVAREDLLNKRNQLDGERQRSAEEALKMASEADRAFGHLPSSYRALVASKAPDGDAWVDTVYPTPVDMEEAKKRADGKEAHTEHLEDLREQSKQKGTWEETCQKTESRLAKLLEASSWGDVRGVRDDLKACENRRRELRAEIAQLEETHREATEEAKRWADTAENLAVSLREGKIEVESLLAIRGEIERVLHVDLAKLSEDWRERAESAGPDEVAGWREERDNLDRYEALYSEVQDAARSLSSLIERITGIEGQLDGIPERAKRPRKKVEAELSAARSAAEGKDLERRSAGERFGQLERQRESNQELEESRQDAERQRMAYDTLHTLLGPRGLQGRLLRAAERDLVSLANQALDRLSRGRMALGLREGDQHRALDLVVYDSDTGANEVAVGLTSGSQRFRIAVSLALAIGRYKGQRARRIQSVIVDEGFGSLDKHSRDDMIQVLNDLRQELDKIILVSHQDEFAGAFTNGYAVSLEDTSSKVEILQS